MSDQSSLASAPAQAFTGVYVFGDSLVDPGNALKAAQALDSIPFVSLPNGAPTADKGYFQGRFTDGYNFADLISNKLLLVPTKATFPYGFEDPVFGLSLPFVNRPEGANLSFAYGGAQALRGAEPVPDLDGQTDIYQHYTPDPGALYIVTMGGNDIRGLVPRSGDLVVGDAAAPRLSAIAAEIAQEVGQLYGRGARHILVTGMPDVGLIPEYIGSVNEAGRRSLATDYAERLDGLVRGALDGLTLPAGAKLYNFDFLGLTDAALGDPAAYRFTNLTQARTTVQAGVLEAVGGGFLFFDKVHPSAQAHALIAADILDSLATSGAPASWSAPPSIGSQAVGAIPVGGADRFTASLLAGQTYVLDLLGISSGLGSLADPTVRVLDASGAILARDDDGGLGLDAHLQFLAPGAGDYVIEIAGVGVAGGTYRVQMGDLSGANLLLTGGLRGSDVVVQGGAGADTIGAIAGANSLRGAEGADSLQGGSGFDDLNGNSGNDTVQGGAGADWVSGGKDNDVLFGDDGGDILSGNLGDDIVYGNSGNDVGDGGDGNDWVRGGQGDDVVVGGSGDDWLSGDRGSDSIVGGSGADIFHSFAGAGLDRVLDFNSAERDRVQLDQGTTYTVTQVGADVLIDMIGGAQTVLVGVGIASLTYEWIFTA